MGLTVLLDFWWVFVRLVGGYEFGHAVCLIVKDYYFKPSHASLMDSTNQHQHQQSQILKYLTNTQLILNIYIYLSEKIVK